MSSGVNRGINHRLSKL